MPFIAQTKRQLIHKDGPSACTEVGDITFVFYEQMVKVWNREPRWRTAHRIYRDFGSDDFYNYVRTQLADKFSQDDVKVAQSLAWQVFFQWFVMPYEVEKSIQNGSI